MQRFTQILRGSIKEMFTFIISQSILGLIFEGVFLLILWLLFVYLPKDQALFAVVIGLIVLIYYILQGKKREEQRQKDIRDKLKKSWKK